MLQSFDIPRDEEAQTNGPTAPTKKLVVVNYIKSWQIRVYVIVKRLQTDTAHFAGSKIALVT